MEKSLLQPPIFDNGLSLFCYAGKEDYENLDEYAKTRSNPYNISYEEICEEVMGNRQKEQLRRMIGFRFERHPTLNLPEDNLQAIEKHLEGRVCKLLAIPTSYLRKKGVMEQKAIVIFNCVRSERSFFEISHKM